MRNEGVINLNKPKGITSFEAVRRIRKLLKRKVGHGGTLDPDASGVLPILVGKATRIQEYLRDLRKTYMAKIELGKETDTYDSSGKILRLGDFSKVSRGDVERAISRFIGEVEQLPPPFSAIKYRGKPLYELARKGEDVPLKPRRVIFYNIKLLSFSPPYIELEVECGWGAYIRSLAKDIGDALGCGAHLKELVRTRYGPMKIEEALRIEDVYELVSRGEDVFHPIDWVLQHLPEVKIEDQGFLFGRPIKINMDFKGKVRVYKDDEFLGIGESDGEILKPLKVLKV